MLRAGESGFRIEYSCDQRRDFCLIPSPFVRLNSLALPSRRWQEVAASSSTTEGATGSGGVIVAGGPAAAALREGGESVVGLVNASILAADMADLSGEVGRVIEAGADWIHVDVVDNHFAKVSALGCFCG